MNIVLRNLMIVVLVILLSGCGAVYTSESQYEDGNFSWMTGSKEVARIKQDKMAMEKLKESDVMAKKENGVIQGYKVILANLSHRKEYTFRVDGPEKRAFMLTAGEQIEVYLIPGEYRVSIVRNGKESESRRMRVDAEKKRFGGTWCHGFAYKE